MRTEMTLYQSVQDYNVNTRKKNFSVEARNAYYNHQMIWKDINEKGNIDVGRAPKHHGEPALIIGSGQSLDEAGPLLKDWKGAVFTSSSQATTLVYYGKDPTYVVLLDPFTGVDEFQGVDDWEGRDCTLITHPCMAPILGALWPCKKLYYRPLEPMTPFYTEVLTAGYGDIVPTFMFLFSCTLSAQLGMAKCLGYNPLFLVGCDFGAPDERYRFTRWYWEAREIAAWRWNEGAPDGERMVWEWIKPDELKPHHHLIKVNGEWKAEDGGTVPSGKEIVTSWSGVKTDPLQIYYKRSVICVSRLDMSDIINTSTKGVLSEHEYPRAEIGEVIEKQGRGFEHLCWDEQTKADKYEAYLATQNTYCLVFNDNSKRFVETTDPERDAIPFCRYENQQREKLGSPVRLDENYNMERIRHVRELAKRTYGDDVCRNTSVDAVAGARAYQP